MLTRIQLSYLGYVLKHATNYSMIHIISVCVWNICIYWFFIKLIWPCLHICVKNIGTILVHVRSIITCPCFIHIIDKSIVFHIMCIRYNRKVVSIYRNAQYIFFRNNQILLRKICLYSTKRYEVESMRSAFNRNMMEWRLHTKLLWYTCTQIAFIAK